MDYAIWQTANTTNIDGLSTVRINVPYRRPGNVVEHLPVFFTVWKDENNFKAFPLCNEEIQRVLNLPDALRFKLRHGEVYAHKHSYEEVAKEIAEELKINVLD